MMDNKLGLNPNLPTDMFGNPVYNSVAGPYGAVQNPGMKQGSSDTGGVGNYLKSAGETLSGALQKVGDNLSSYYQNVGDDASRVLQHNVYGNLTPEQHAEAIKYPFKPVGQFADGFFAMPPDNPEDYASKPLLWRGGRLLGKHSSFWDSGRQYGQLATDIQRRDMRGEPVSERDRAQANQYRDEFLVDAAKTAAGLATTGGVYAKLKP